MDKFIDTIPFEPEKKEIINKLFQDIQPDQLQWLQGFIQGYINGQKTHKHFGTKATGATEATVLFGSHTGNSKKIANKLKDAGKSQNLNIKVEDMSNYSVRKLKDEKNLLIVVSTHGEGDPPVSAEDFYHYIFSKKAPNLKDTNYSVLALGDKSYVHYCKTGADIDNQLARLGGNRLLDRIECDVDYHTNANNWINKVIEKLKSAAPQSDVQVSALPTGIETDVEIATRENPVEAEVVEHINLNGRGSSKTTIHAELLFENDGIVYKPGDSLGIWPKNDKALADLIIQKMNFKEEEVYTYDNKDLPLQEILYNEVELAPLTRGNIEKYLELNKNEELKDILNDTSKLANYLYGRDILDLLLDYPANISASEFLAVVRKLQPRLYSLASSALYAPGEAHITVAEVVYTTSRRLRRGTCSSYISQQLLPDNKLKAFIDTNDFFRLPEHPDSDIIMVGPGTGVAPFRAFLQEREVNEARGKNWLFFGDRNFTTDFLYQAEWQKWLKTDHLHNLDVAFSRDQKEKLYVQHKMLQKSKQLYDWLENGAHFYVCGDKNRMAPDVEGALHQIISSEGGLSEDKTKEYIKTLKKQKRYLEDVY